MATSAAQTTEWMQYMEDLANSEEETTENIENLLDELSYLAGHPYNLQTVTKKQLEKLPFLSDTQIENLLYYIYKYSPLVDIHELKNVEDLDIQTINYLLPFVYVGEPLEKQRTYTKQELMVRTNQQADYLNFRYNLKYRDKLQFGMTGEKDAGERFPPFDYYTFNLAFQDLGMLEELHFGNYRLSFGQGLVLNTGFSMGKSVEAMQFSLKNKGIQRHLSTNESQYFSGFAGALRLNNSRLTLFYSHRRLDATTDSNRIYSFKTDGYHRTYNDWLKRETASVELFGSNWSWQKDAFSMGATAVYYSFGNQELNPTPHPYNLFYLRGKNHFNASIDYRYQRKKFSVQGETAIDKAGKMATIHTFVLQPVSFLEWISSFRYYDRAYNALYGKGFSEATTVQNETGFYTGIKIHPFRRWECSAYWDVFRFPWLKYGINTPSSGDEFYLLVKYQPHTNLQMSGLYRYKEKQENRHRWRYQLNYKLNNWSFKTQADYNRHQSESENADGYGITQNVSYAPSARFQLDASCTYFHTDNWNTRITLYEKNVLYAFSFPSYYGEGLRYNLVLKWKIYRPLTFYLKCATTQSFDREDKTDIYGLVKYDF
ncbi:hypothetical protein AGMMS50262_20010 [Bacteroidia bacterium]|nr:hypothetical protein AGMMS50262_20010 [Bacteroidia bacterium]